MNNKIHGKVAKVLNSNEVALNIGSEDGVKIDMYFDIMDPTGENISDPETGEILGSVERSKVRVKVTKIQKKLSIASTFKERRKNIGGTGLNYGVLSKALMPPKWVTELETLKTEEKTWEDLEERESYVKTGDPVVEVTESTNLKENK